ncbi:hypothetical protein LAZ67_7000485 [Cordylochernes scorpioides]|uniref:Integrase catalytic domain-containing protein n=1 Tax=Cordylochernes scorpioides TaxID=51811 RepID=A0ABY6KLI5_9ARAC|nr:hypothetical protein LAZ67_7000485 [Cordylochernes scorpioides]
MTRGIQTLLTTSNNPQANGLIERLNATITGKFRLAYLENPKASWTQLVKRVTQNYNNTPHSVTSFSPTYLMFNVIPLDLRTHLNPYPEINIAREIVSSRTQNKHKKDKETFDKQHRTPHLEVNDLFLVKNYRSPDTGKLAPYFTGPYTIFEIISPNVVRIDRPNQPLNRDSDTIHVNKLKYYTENVPYITPPQPRFVQNPQRWPQDIYLSEFNHLTPDIFETQLFRIIPPTTSQPFLHLNPEDYYQNKTVMGMKLNLPTDILIESLTEGLPVADQRLIATVQLNTIKEWFDLVSRIRRTQCATSTAYQCQVDKAPHPTYHNPPPRYNNQRS